MLAKITELWRVFAHVSKNEPQARFSRHEQKLAKTLRFLLANVTKARDVTFLRQMSQKCAPATLWRQAKVVKQPLCDLEPP